MSSDFEKALECAAAARNEADAMKAQQERERIEKVALARSIVDAYLSGLGPQVVATLRKLGVAPIRQSGGGSGVWAFEYGRHADQASKGFALCGNGDFETGYISGTSDVLWWMGGGRFYAAYWQGDRFWWEDGWKQEKDLWVESNTGRVYLRLEYLDPQLKGELNYRSLRYGEIGEFIAEYIYTRMLK